MNTKGILLAGLLALTFNLHAVPYLEVKFLQDNWTMYVEMSVKDDVTGEPIAARFGDGDIPLGYGGAIRYSGYLLEELTGQSYVGEHFPWARIDDDLVLYGATYVVSQPTGQRPEYPEGVERLPVPEGVEPLPQPTPIEIQALAAVVSVPELASSFWLMSISLVGLAFLRRSHSSNSGGNSASGSSSAA